MTKAIAFVAYDDRWPAEFDRLGTALREALGNVALRIDHFVSTAVPGLAAKGSVDDRRGVGAARLHALRGLRPRPRPARPG